MSVIAVFKGEHKILVKKHIPRYTVIPHHFAAVSVTRFVWMHTKKCKSPKVESSSDIWRFLQSCFDTDAGDTYEDFAVLR